MFPCPICDVKLNSVEQKKAHCRGKNHIKRMAARDKALELGTDFDSTPDYCDVCNVPLTSKMTAIDHFKGKMHQKKVKTNEEHRQGFQNYCDVCDVKLQSLKVSEAHFNGKQHRKRERKNLTRGKEKNPANERKPKPPRAEKVSATSPSSFASGELASRGSSTSTWESLNCNNDSDSKDPLSEFRSILSGKSNSPETPHSNSPKDPTKPHFSFDNVDISQMSTFHNNESSCDTLPSQFNNSNDLGSSSDPFYKKSMPSTHNTKAGPIHPPICLSPRSTEELFKALNTRRVWQPRANLPSYLNNPTERTTRETRLAQQYSVKNGIKDGHCDQDQDIVRQFYSVLHVLGQTIYPISSGDIARNVGCLSPSEVNTLLADLEKLKMVTKSGHSPVLWLLATPLRQHTDPEQTCQIYPPNGTSHPEIYTKDDSPTESYFFQKTNEAYFAETSKASQVLSTQSLPPAMLSSSTTFATRTPSSEPLHCIEIPPILQSNLINLLQQNGPTTTTEIVKKLNLTDVAKLQSVLHKLLERRVITVDTEAPQRWRIATAPRLNSVGVIGEERKRKSPVQNGLISKETFRERTPSPPQQNNPNEKIHNGFCNPTEPNTRTCLQNNETKAEYSRGEQEKNTVAWQHRNHFNSHMNVPNGSVVHEQPRSEIHQFYHDYQGVSSHDNRSEFRKPIERPSPSPPPVLQTETNRFLDDLTETPPTDYQRELYEQAMQEDVVCYLPAGTGQGVVMASVVHHMHILNPTKQTLVVVENTVSALESARCLRKELGCKTKRKKLNVALFSGQLKQSNGKAQVAVVTSATCLRLLNCGALSWRDVCLLIFDRADLCSGDRPSHQILRDYYIKAKSDCRDLHVPKLLGFIDSTAGEDNLTNTVAKFNAVLGNMGDVFLAGVTKFQEELKERKTEAMFVCVPSSITEEEKRMCDFLRRYLILVFENLSSQWQPLNSYRELFELSLQEYPVNGEAFLELTRLTGQSLEKRLPSMCLKIWRHYLAICEVMLALVECGEDFAMELLVNMKREAFGFTWASNAGLPANDLLVHLQPSVLPKTLPWGSNGSNVFGSGIRELLEQLMIIQWENARVSSERPLALVIVKLSKTAKMLASYLARYPELAKRNVKTTFVDGSRSSHQKALLSAIKRRQYQVIVSTEDVEDTLDLPLCELVVLLHQPTTSSTLIRLRKRQARNVVAICREPDGEKKLKALLKQEELVEKAINVIRGAECV